MTHGHVKPKKRFELTVNDAGNVQLLITDENGSGLRLLGAKGSPYGRTLHKWQLSEDQLKRLIDDLKKTLKRKAKP